MKDQMKLNIYWGAKAKILKWSPKTSFSDLVKMMVENIFRKLQEKLLIEKMLHHMGSVKLSLYFLNTN